jgi:hypothetical protein
MSKKEIQTCCLVIDASIAKAAGTGDRPPTIAANCRVFLEAVWRICYRMAWSEAITAEWEKHKRGFAAKWLVSMRSKRKLLRVRDDESLTELCNAIREHSKDPNLVEKMLKDAHLFEAALATDLRIVSWDTNAHDHFGRLAATHDRLRSILWADPVTEGEKAVEWLESGAPAERSRRLKA